MIARFAPWLSRAVLLVATALLTIVAVKFILNPVSAALASHMTLDTPVALTNMRAGFGAFPLTCAMVTLICLMSGNLRVAGLGFIALLMGIVLIVRIFGILADGTLAESLRVLTAEGVVFALAVLGLLGEQVRASRARHDNE